MKKVTLILTLILLTVAAVLLVEAAPPSGAIFTTTPNGGIVNENVHYDLKREVYLDGGPPPNAPKTAAGLDDGWYVFQVTDPSGHYLLSMDPSKCRVFEVIEGVIVRLVPPTEFGFDDNNWTMGNGKKNVIPCHTDDPPTLYTPAGPDDYGVSGQHDVNVDVDHGGGEGDAIVVQLMPYGTTPNPGGVYKAWITPYETYSGDLGNNPSPVRGKKSQPCPDYCFAPDPGFGPPRSDSKTDNFKVQEFFPPEVTVRKYHDLNCDGVWDGAEPEIGVDQFVLPDGTIDPAGGGWPYDWTYPLNGGTATEGFYTPMTHVAAIPGTYSALEMILNGWGQCAAFLDTVPLGITNPVDVDVAGLSYETHEIVFGDCQLARVEGKKVIDLNADGDITGDVCDPADSVNYPGCSGVTVHLDGMDNLNNPVHLTTLTDYTGHYAFEGLYPGSYTITVDEPNGFECSYPLYGDCGYDVDLLCTDDEDGFDFGDFSRAEVYGRKVIDITGDGPSADDTCPLVPDPWGNNSGCAGVTVYLDGWANLGWEVHETTTTDAAGYFAFTELYPGDYTVTIGEPAGFYCSYPTPCEFDLSLDSDEVVSNLVFGDLSKAEVYGRKVIDIYADGPSADDTCPLDPDPWGNNDGCQGVTVHLDGADGMGNEVHLTTLTDDAGYFEFTELWPGDYVVTVDEPAGFYCSYPFPCEFSLSLMSDEIASGLVFGDYSLAEIHAYKFFDANENGQPDTGEAPVAGITFNLYDGDGNLIASGTTGADGMVWFMDLMPGAYMLEEVLPYGWYPTTDPIQSATFISDQIWEPEFGNVTNCIGLTPGYWGNWDNHYTEAQFLLLLQGTIGEGESLATVNHWLSSVGCDDGDALHCMRRFLLANQLTLSLTQKAPLYPDMFVPVEGGRPVTLFYACQVPGVPYNLGQWIDRALAILADPGAYSRDEILEVKTVLDQFANLTIIAGW